MTIYKITNRLNGKIYIGQTSQPLEKRFYQHSKANTPLGNAMRQCGLENFTIETVETCETYDELNQRERFWIRVLNCKVPKGYNQSDGGESCTVKHFKPRKAYAPITVKMTVAESLKRFRSEYGLSQKEVAETVGMVPTSYYRYESGRYLPQTDIIITLAKAYNVSADYLLGLSDTPRPSGVDEKQVREAQAFKKALKDFVMSEERAQA